MMKSIGFAALLAIIPLVKAEDKKSWDPVTLNLAITDGGRPPYGPVLRTYQFYDKWTYTVPATITPATVETSIQTPFSGSPPYTMYLNYYSVKDLPQEVLSHANGPNTPVLTRTQNFYSQLQTTRQPPWCTNTRWEYAHTTAGVAVVPEAVEHQVTPVATNHVVTRVVDSTTYMTYYWILSEGAVPGPKNTPWKYHTVTTGELAEAACTSENLNVFGTFAPTWVPGYTPPAPTPEPTTTGSPSSNGGKTVDGKTVDGKSVDGKATTDDVKALESKGDGAAKNANGDIIPSSSALGSRVEMWTTVMGSFMALTSVGLFFL